MSDPTPEKSTARKRLLREVTEDELLGREPLLLLDSMISEQIRGKRVLVTGAAGSIGSELCRQISRCQPAAIIALDSAESPLFELQQEMLASSPGTAFYCAIGNIQNERRIEEIFREHTPHLCFHAAAYKHVPLMEEHIFEAIENNVLGTAVVLRCAVKYSLSTFVLISSDKAVRPTSLMGATKRLAECLLDISSTPTTRCMSVRFGNVLGSTGSVLTIFRRQLAAGGPLTVTHPDMQRYFMTIPEACRLVLQASALPGHDGVFILEMGEQIRIIDLAQRLIRLSGLEPRKDVHIRFTGIRPGEKISEELSHLFEDTVSTPHPKIRVAVAAPTDRVLLHSQLNTITLACARRDARGLLSAIQVLVPDYRPSEQLLSRLRRDPDSLTEPG